MIGVNPVSMPGPSAQGRRQPVQGWRVLAALAATVAASVALGYATRALVLMWAPAQHPNLTAVTIVFEVYSLLIVSLFVALGGWKAGVVELRLARPTRRQIGRAAGAWTAAYLVALGFHQLVHGLWPGFPSPSDLWKQLVFIGSDMGRLPSASAVLTLLVAVRACLLAPVAEELLFRGALFGWLRDRWSSATTIAVSAMAFAAIHGGAATIVPLALAIGIAAGWARERDEATMPVVLIHLVQNVALVTVAAFLR
jgi:membrane protease YdiL (CAAX protease family)